MMAFIKAVRERLQHELSNKFPALQAKWLEGELKERIWWLRAERAAWVMQRLSRAERGAAGLPCGVELAYALPTTPPTPIPSTHTHPNLGEGWYSDGTRVRPPTSHPPPSPITHKIACSSKLACPLLSRCGASYIRDIFVWLPDVWWPSTVPIDVP